MFGDRVHLAFSCCIMVPKCLGRLGDLQDVSVLWLEAKAVQLLVSNWGNLKLTSIEHIYKQLGNKTPVKVHSHRVQEDIHNTCTLLHFSGNIVIYLELAHVFPISSERMISAVCL